MGRLEAAARRSELRVGGVNLPLLGLSVVRRVMDVRVMGLSAEMTYYAVLSVFPLIGALGAGLGFLERVVGPTAKAHAEAAIHAGLDVVLPN
jgi:membrane protein